MAGRLAVLPAIIHVRLAGSATVCAVLPSRPGFAGGTGADRASFC